MPIGIAALEFEHEKQEILLLTGDCTLVDSIIWESEQRQSLAAELLVGYPPYLIAAENGGWL
jgi:hypothetical protein